MEKLQSDLEKQKEVNEEQVNYVQYKNSIYNIV